MRIPGTLFIIGGIFLCVSVVWADVGFVTIGFGVFFVLIAEWRDARPRPTSSRPTSSRRTSSGSLPSSPVRSSPAASGVDKAEVGQGAFEIRQERSFDRDSAQSAAPTALRADQVQAAQQAPELFSRNSAWLAGPSLPKAGELTSRQDPLQPLKPNQEPFKPTASRVDQIELRREPPPLPERGGSQLASSTAEGFEEAEVRREPFLAAQSDGRSPEATALGAANVGYGAEASLRRGQEVSQASDSVAGQFGTESVPHLRSIGKNLPAPTAAFSDETREVKIVLVPSERRKDQLQSAVSPFRDAMEKWRAVVDGDVDISQAVAALAPFGKKYVDELARAYLVLDDKDYLPLILKKIAATVKKDTGRDFVSTALIDLPATDLRSGAPGKAAPLKASPISDVRAGGVDLIFNRNLTDLPETGPETQQGLPMEGAVAQTRLGQAEGEPGYGQAAIDTISHVSGTAAVDLDEAEDLKDLLSRLNLQSGAGQRP
jgi:hypothetical protein